MNMAIFHGFVFTFVFKSIQCKVCCVEIFFINHSLESVDCRTFNFKCSSTPPNPKLINNVSAVLYSQCKYSIRPTWQGNTPYSKRVRHSANSENKLKYRKQ